MEFVDMMNSVDRDIKFTIEINWEDSKIFFMDLTISIDKNGYLQTNLYTKPNAKNCLLLPSSTHKPSVTKSSVYSLAVRIVRICSQEEVRDKRLEELAAKLMLREYSDAVKSNNRFVLRHLETKAINNYKMVEAGVNKRAASE